MTVEYNYLNYFCVPVHEGPYPVGEVVPRGHLEFSPAQ